MQRFNLLQRNTERGFTLVETLVAITILLIVIVGPMTIASRGMQTAFYAGDQTTAIYLAQEGIEHIQRLRDDTALALTRIAAVVLAIGIFGISLMPVLLRMQIPIESAQFLALAQGLIVAAGGLLGLAIYRHRERASAETSARARQRLCEVGR